MTDRSASAVVHEPYVTQALKRLDGIPREWLDAPERTPLEAILRIWPGWDLALPQSLVQPYEPFTFVTYPLRHGDLWAAVPFLALDWTGDAAKPQRRAVALMKTTEAAAVSKDLTALAVWVVAAAGSTPTAQGSVQWWRRLWGHHHPEEPRETFDLLVGLAGRPEA